MIFGKIYYFSILIIRRFLPPIAAVDFCPCAERTCNNIWDNFPDALPLWIFYFDKEIYNHGIEGTLELELDTGGQFINVPSRKSPVLYCDGTGPCVKTFFNEIDGWAWRASIGRLRSLFAVWVKMNDRQDELERMKTSPVKKTELIYFPEFGNKLSYDQETGEWSVAFKDSYRSGNFTYPMNNSHRWNHIAVSTLYDDEWEIRFYINGDKVKSVPYEEFQSPHRFKSPTFFGPTPDQTVYSRFFVDTMRLWRKEFTDEEVMEIYQDELEFED